jgi:UDP-N-acetylmuramate dehydrogenase
MLTQTLLSVRGRLFYNASLAEYNSWRVGGPAEIVYIPADIDDISCFMQQLSQEKPLLWLGLGSNILIRDGGVEGAVLVTQGALNGISQLDSEHIRVEAGVSCAQIARYTARLGWRGLEFMAGIPGTVGGALFMNAGCYGGETWQHVVYVETMDRHGQKRTRPASDYHIAYRQVTGPENEWFVAGHFKLQKGNKTDALHEIRELLEKRNASQPTGLPNCGSTFRNPPNQSAGWLIDQSGLKGFKIGGAYVSQKHANFLINDGSATAADIEALIERIVLTVLKQHGVRLSPEVCIMGKSTAR